MLAVLFRDIELGRYNIRDKLALKNEQQAGGSGILKEMESGLVLSLKDIATLMIVLSDNTATNMLINLLGLEHINSSIEELGYKDTKLKSCVDFDAIGDNAENVAISTPLEFRSLLDRIALNAILSEESCSSINDIMKRQQYVDQIPRYLDYNPYAHDLGLDTDLVIANKTGFFMGVRCDVAFIFYKYQAWTLVFFTKNCQDLSFNIDNEGSVLVGRIAEQIFDYFSSF